MARENAEIVREIYQGWSRGDFSVGTEHFSPDIEFISHFGVDRATSRGPEAMRRVWAEHLRNWDEWRTGDIQDLRDLGDSILVENSVHGVGRRSGINVEIHDAAVVFRFHEGKIVWLLATDRLEAALEAVGLRE